MRAVIFLGSCGLFSAIDNGLGQRPPMGWRSWNQFQCNINQSLIEEHYRIMASHTFGSKSLLELGYATAGIDDCWQLCNSGPDGQGFHDKSGYPIVDTSSFPNMHAMTKVAKGLGILPGWYGNNCHCKDMRCSDQSCFEGDVKATLDFGFESIKLDGCGIEKNVTLFAELFNQTGVPVMIENCHNGNPTYPSQKSDGSVKCPMNFFRSSTDIRPTFGSMLINLRSTIQYNSAGLTGPGCWAYPDMLEVGVTNSQREAVPTLSVLEARTHFAAWCIVSAPLVLGNDLRDAATMREIWDIIANEESIAVNQAWAGDAGSLAAQSDKTVTLQNCSWFNDDPCEHPSWMIWKKQLPSNQLAVLVMNNDFVEQEVVVSSAQVGLDCNKGCTVRDLYKHQDDASVTDQWTAKLASHDSQFVILTPTQASRAVV